MAKSTRREREPSTKAREKKVTSFQIYTDTKKKVNYISMMDEKDITDIVQEALDNYVQSWEKKNGAIPIKNG